MTTIGILPCAGTASRLHGLPKFMLPLKEENGCLLSRWVEILIRKGCSNVIIGVSNNNFEFVRHVLDNNLSHLKHLVNIKNLGKTETMNETLIRSLENESFDKVIMAMPDTYVDDIDIDFLEYDIVGVNLWNIRNTQVGKIGQCNIQEDKLIDIIDKDSKCNYNYGWGVIVFKSEFMKYILKEEPHTGYSLKTFMNSNKLVYKIINGLYFDCGTVQGYMEFLNSSRLNKPVHIKGTIIIMAIYINNTKKCLDELVKCLKQIRKVYPNEIIVGVNNTSLNDSWKILAKELKIEIIDNHDKSHRYEMGAYKKALEYYRADNYICVQGTFFLHKKINLESLKKDKADAMCFEMIDKLYWNDYGLNLINKYLSLIDLGKWQEYSKLVSWDSFICNNLFMEDMINDGLFSLITNRKDHSCCLERVLGYYFTKKLGNVLTVDRSSFEKIFLKQL
jgi:hypothetical protein